MRIFKEQQRFTQTWLIALIVISTIMPLIVILKDSDKMSTSGLITTICVVLLAPAIIFFFKLNTRIDEKGIHYQFFPIHFKFKTITWQEINVAYIRKYDAISEYGGWGLKGGALWNKSKGTAINVSGDIGIQLELKTGKKLLIGTQLEEQAKQVLETYKQKIN